MNMPPLRETWSNPTDMGSMVQDEVQQPERNQSQEAVNHPGVNATENADTSSKGKRTSPVGGVFQKHSRRTRYELQLYALLWFVWVEKRNNFPQKTCKHTWITQEKVAEDKAQVSFATNGSLQYAPAIPRIALHEMITKALRGSWTKTFLLPWLSLPPSASYWTSPRNNIMSHFRRLLQEESRHSSEEPKASFFTSSSQLIPI